MTGLLLCCALFAAAKDYKTASPDGKLQVTFHTGKATTFEVWYHGTQITKPSAVAMHLADGRTLEKVR